jgi:hypothetical protein
MKMEQIECSETSTYKIQTPGYNPEESIQQSRPCKNIKYALKIIHEDWTFKHRFGTHWGVGLRCEL